MIARAVLWGPLEERAEVRGMWRLCGSSNLLAGLGAESEVSAGRPSGAA